jgi:uncharacterized membrane protein
VPQGAALFVSANDPIADIRHDRHPELVSESIGAIAPVVWEGTMDAETSSA